MNYYADKLNETEAREILGPEFDTVVASGESKADAMVQAEYSNGTDNGRRYAALVCAMNTAFARGIK